MVTFITDSGYEKFMFLLHKQSEQSFLTTDNQNMYICEGVTTIHFKNMMLTQAGDTHRSMFSGYYICKIMVVIACFLIQADVTPFPVVTNARNGSSVVVLYN